MLTKNRLKEAGKIDVMGMKVADVFEYFDRIVDEVFDDVGEEGKKSLVLSLAAAKSDFLIECLLNHREPIDYKKWVENKSEFDKQMEKVKEVEAKAEAEDEEDTFIVLYNTYNTTPEYIASLKNGNLFSPRARAKELWNCMRKFCEYRDILGNEELMLEGRFLLFSTGKTTLRIDFYSNKTIEVRVLHYGEVVYSYKFNVNGYSNNTLRLYSRRITRHLGAYARKLEKMCI